MSRSNLEDFVGEDAGFKPLIADPEHESGKIKSHEEIDRVILCSGQVWTALSKYRADNKIDNVALTRLEQLNPFPWQQLKDNLDQYPNAKTIVWAQEEPLNAGAWSFTQPRIETLLNQTEHHDRKHVIYAGRNPSASVATGLKHVHGKEEADFLKDAFTVVQDKLKGE
jgi:2-oxoglutarate dehydrogenase E1 component